ncbi:TIGR01620 family protein [Psittacicella hinzii]|uniref:TIGR01620 family protein n=1 Tax=Psittacicella hinzii TaxID=2028575 RepID=A0A3A1YM97_9GAMM|nr:TIGR01620 family protein [Psittacicella hinzii]RIY38586.1 TIGR01620 family protein [Psittacicella hinzii]
MVQGKKTFTPEEIAQAQNAANTSSPLHTQSNPQTPFTPKQVFSAQQMEQMQAKTSDLPSGHEEEARSTTLLKSEKALDLASELTPSKLLTWMIRLLSLFVGSIGLIILYQVVAIGQQVFNLFTGAGISGTLLLLIAKLLAYGGLLGITLWLVYFLYHELNTLNKLRRHEEQQRAAGVVMHAYATVNTAANITSITHHQGSQIFTQPQQAILWCEQQLKTLDLNQNHPAIVKWRQSVSNYQNSEEVLMLFSRLVLEPLDKEVLQIVHQRAATDAIIIALSPYPSLDMAFLAWRNATMIKKVAKIYGVELGYFARLSLYKHILVNIAVVGVSESLEQMTDLSGYLSTSIVGKISSKAAQGIGIGLLSARLGIKAMEFSRPLPFNSKNCPQLLTLGKEIGKKVIQVTLKGKSQTSQDD